MPYASRDDLPEAVREHLPGHAQDIYREAFNSAWDRYRDPERRRGDDDRETVAHKVAWAAVNNEYEKGKEGRWRRKPV
jgi:cation transport regulator